MHRFAPLIIAVLCLLHGTGWVLAQPEAVKPITTVAEAMRVDLAAADSTKVLVNIQGIIVATTGNAFRFYLHDGTGTVLVQTPTLEPSVRAGRKVTVAGHVTGITHFNRTHPMIVARQLTQGDDAPMPAARPVTLTTLNTFSSADQWVSVEAAVVSWEYVAPLLKIKLASRDGLSAAVVQLSDRAKLPPRLIGARLRLTGVNSAGPSPDEALQIPSIGGVEVLEPGTEDVFEAPLVSIPEINFRKVEGGRRVRVRGTLAAVIQGFKFVIVSDGQALISSVSDSRGPDVPGTLYGDVATRPNPKPGDIVEIVGSSVETASVYQNTFGLLAGFARIVGKGEVPVPERLSIEQLLALRQGDRWVTVEGVVGAWSLQAGTKMYYLLNDEHCSMTFPVRSVPDVMPKDLWGARVRFTGFATTLYQTGQGSDFMVPSNDFVEFLSPGKQDQFDAPEHPLDQVAAGKAPPAELIKTRGVLIGRVNRTLYLRKDDAAICVSLKSIWVRPPGLSQFAEGAPPPPLKVGDEIEVAGHAVRSGTNMLYAPFDLVNAQAKVIEHTEDPKPVEADFASILSGAHNSDLVQTRGRLLTWQHAPIDGGLWRTTLLLKANGQKLTAIHESKTLNPFNTLQPNDDVLLTGVVNRATPQGPRHLAILSPTDVKSLGFSAELVALRFWIWGGSVLLVVGGLGAWIWMLRRSHRRQLAVAASLKEANDAARASEQRWKLLFEQSPLSVQIFAPDGQTKRFNEAWRKLFQLSDEQAYAFNVLKDPALNASGAVNLMRGAFRGEVVHVPPVPFPVNSDPPEVRWIGGVLYPVKNEAGEVLEVVTIHNDITDMKRAEEAMQKINQTLEQRVTERTAELEVARADLAKALDQERELNELKSRFVSMVSHEFRTPLGVTMSAVEIMRQFDERLTAEKRRELCDEIYNSTVNMAGLMEQVLLLGRVEAGKLGFKPTPLNIDGLVRRIIDESQSATHRKCPIDWKPESNLTVAEGDEALLRHILSNLITNAVKYSPENTEVTVKAHRDGMDAVIEVIDRGIGIPEKDLPHLYEAFHRAGNVTNIPGTGLGLVIVKRCVELHRGLITVKSEIGRGTTFTVRVPVFPHPSSDVQI